MGHKENGQWVEVSLKWTPVECKMWQATALIMATEWNGQASYSPT